jgi:hypothetical protein
MFDLTSATRTGLAISADERMLQTSKSAIINYI